MRIDEARADDTTCASIRLAASVSGKIADGDDAIASNANIGATC